jgi:hypothetical protein
VPGFDSALISAVLGLGLGLGVAFLIRRLLALRPAKKAANAPPKVYASRQEMRKEERARLKAERAASKRAKGNN